MGKIILEGATAELEVKKSRFIATVTAIHTADEAAEELSRARRNHYDAKHHCSAYIIEGNPPLSHASDDGEPQGTAGRPILEILEGAGLTDVILIVTRYFGGTLLGTGGLSRAYREAARLAVEGSRIGERITVREITVRTDYNDYGRISRAITDSGYALLDTDYGADVTSIVAVPEGEAEQFVKRLTDLSGGRAHIALSNPKLFVRE